MMSPKWDAVLDDFAGRLSAQLDALDAGEGADVPPFVPPAATEPLPAHLQERAERLLEQAISLQHEIERRMASTGRDLHVVQRVVSATASTSGASYVDRAL